MLACVEHPPGCLTTSRFNCLFLSRTTMDSLPSTARTDFAPDFTERRTFCPIRHFPIYCPAAAAAMVQDPHLSSASFSLLPLLRSTLPSPWARRYGNARFLCRVLRTVSECRGRCTMILVVTGKTGYLIQCLATTVRCLDIGTARLFRTLSTQHMDGSVPHATRRTSPSGHQLCDWRCCLGICAFTTLCAAV
jgi:hypothetical protein